MWAEFLRAAWRDITTKRPYNEIEPKVKPLVDKMNATGLIKTVASCQGHAILGKPPYIYFKAPSAVAALIEKLLREAAFADARFNDMWVVEGMFDQNYELTFLLYSPLRHQKSHSILAIAVFLWSRQRLDADFLHLAGVVDYAALLYARKKYEPEVTADNNK